MGQVGGRHYGMDWLRIGAFQLLILYHVGMAFVPWAYQVKVVSPPLAWATIPMLLTNPWRLSLLFAVSGYASAALLARQAGGLGGFVRSRLARLGLPLLFGMAVVVTPQPWVWLVTQYGYRHGFGHFLAHDYYRFQTIGEVAMPTWMHLWFIVYLLAYTLLLAGLLVTPLAWRERCARLTDRALAGPALLPVGIAGIYLARRFLSPGWEETYAFIEDWSAHAVYLAVFLFGYRLRGSEPLQRAVGRWWKLGLVLAIIGWALLATCELVYPGSTPLPHALRLPYQLARAVEALGAIVGLIGLADRHWNFDSRWQPMLAEAVFPFYLTHQTIILLVGYWLLATPTGPLVRFIVLVSATIVGCWAFYLTGRSIPWLRPLIGLKRGEAAAKPTTAEGLDRVAALDGG